METFIYYTYQFCEGLDIEMDVNHEHEFSGLHLFSYLNPLVKNTTRNLEIENKLKGGMKHVQTSDPEFRWTFDKAVKATKLQALLWHNTGPLPGG